MKGYIKSIYSLILMLLLGATACTSDKEMKLDLDGMTRIESIRVNGYKGTIEHKAKKATVHVSTDSDLHTLTIDELTLSDGAVSDYHAGMVFDGSVPRAVKIVNGDVYDIYTLHVQHDKAEITTFMLDGKYAGTIDAEKHTIVCFVPINADVTAMQAVYTLNEGATATPASGSVMDFTNPVVITVSQRTAEEKYTVTVIKDEMSQAPKAFVGNAATVDALGPEAKAACRWMLENVPNSRYISLQDVISGAENLSDYKMIWAHLDFTDWPGTMWDSRDKFNSYWLHGGSILATRDGARYINDVWRIARDQQSPNNMYGGDGYTTLKTDLGFTIKGTENHDIFKNLTFDAQGRVLLLAAGCSNTNRTLQWAVDWTPYGDLAGWEQRTGAKALASGDEYDANRVTIAEFLPYEALKGTNSGRVVTIGTPAYEWYDKNNVDNPYRANIIQLTKNAINYLCQ